MMQASGLSIGEIEYSGAVAGFSFSGSGPSQAMYFVTLKDWEDRKGEGLEKRNEDFAAEVAAAIKG